MRMRHHNTWLVVVLFTAAMLLGLARPAEAACGATPDFQTRWWEHTNCGGAYHAGFANDFVPIMGQYGWDNRASALTIDHHITKVRAWWDTNCTGVNIAFHGNGQDLFWTQVNNDKYSSWKAWSDHPTDGFPAAPASCVNAT